MVQKNENGENGGPDDISTEVNKPDGEAIFPHSEYQLIILCCQQIGKLGLLSRFYKWSN